MGNKPRVHYIPADKYFNLNACGQTLLEAFGNVAFLVGSSLQRDDYRDVDVRMIMADDEFDARFPGEHVAVNPHLSALWGITCTSIGLWLSKQTGLPIDFQIQRRTQANAEHDLLRLPLGLHRGPNPADYGHTAATTLDK